MMLIRSLLAATWGALGLSLSLFGTQPLVGQTIDPDREIVLLTTTDPQLEFPSLVADWHPATLTVWRAALQHRESELRREVADMIRQAHRYGLTGLESLRDPLLEILRDADQSPLTRLSVAQTLIELELVELAPQLDAVAATGSPLLQATIDRGLARWDHGPARQRWRALLARPDADPRLLQTAIRSLATVGDASSVKALRKILFSPQHGWPIRLDAARALARLQSDQVVAWAHQLGGAQASARRAQLVVELLAGATSEEAIALLDALADRDEPTIVAVALERLRLVDPQKVLSRAPQLVVDRDANIRRAVIGTLAQHPSAESVGLLATALADLVPEQRRQARHHLLVQADDGALRPLVIQRATEQLEQEQWRAIEQATMILVELQRHEVSDRLFELIDFPQAEVQRAAAFGLKQLLNDERAAELLAVAERVSQQIAKGEATPGRHAAQAHLLEALGVLRHRPGTELLEQLVPKAAPYTIHSRAAAVWSLGHLLEPATDQRLIGALHQRLADADSDDPEYGEVRAAAAIALGRIGDPESLAELRRWYELESAQSLVGRSCGWAVQQLTGEPLPAAGIFRRRPGNWSVTPLTDG